MNADVPPTAIDLAHEPGFSLAGLQVRPATLEVIAGERRELLEPRIMQVLVALARRRGEVVSRDELNELCWGGRVVGDDALNRCIARLRRLAQAHGGFEIETVPRVGFRLTEGSTGGRPRWWRPRLALGLLAVAILIGGALLLAIMLRPPASGRLRVGVEPVRVVAEDPAARALGATLTDELQTQVAASGVELVGDPGRGADYRLTSTLTRDGERIRVSLRLLDVPAHLTVWSGDVVGPPAEVRQRAGMVGGGATNCAARARAPHAGPIGQQALVDYIRACILVDDPESATEVYTLLERVAAEAPRFAVGRAGRALFAAIAAKDVDEPMKTQLKRKGQSEADEALRLNPAEGTAYLAREMLVEPRTNWIERGRLLDRGVALDPENFGLMSRQGIVLAAAGRLSEAEVFHRRAVTLNPFAANAAAELALTLDSRTSIASARVVIEDAHRRWPANQQVQAVRFEIEALHGDARKAIAMLRDPDYGGQIASPEEREILEIAISARASGSAAELARARAAVRTAARARLWPPLAVQLMAALGDVDGALQAAEAAAGTHADYEPMYLFRASTRSMRNDPRFMRVAQKWGLIDYWRRVGRWPDFCSSPELPYDCKAEAARLSPGQ